MRNIQVSTYVFSQIWAKRLVGEENEDAILTRLLSNNVEPNNSINETTKGFVDSRSGVVFPEGFVIERTYLGRSYKARVVHGHW